VAVIAVEVRAVLIQPFSFSAQSVPRVAGLVAQAVGSQAIAIAVQDGRDAA
jgi:hypothetical protein